MEKARKEHPEAFNGRIYVSPDAKAFAHDFGDGQTYVFASPDAKAFAKDFSGKGKTFFFKSGGPVMSFEMKNISKFVSSISPDQKELNRRQGYLKPSDLTENQRKMLGISGKEKDLTIKINKDGQEITVKSGD